MTDTLPDINLSAPLQPQLLAWLQRNGDRLILADVAARIGSDFANRVMVAIADVIRAEHDQEQTDRIGEHSAVTGDGDPDYCGYCQDGAERDEGWPCTAVVNSVAGDRLSLFRERAEQAEEAGRLAREAGRLAREAVDELGAEVDSERGRRVGLAHDLAVMTNDAAQLRRERNRLATELAEARAALVDLGRTTYADLIEPTPAQITAYLKAARAVVNEGDVLEHHPTTVRAGLAAVQFALLNPPAEPEPMMIRPDDVRPGDWVTLTGPIVPAGHPGDDVMAFPMFGRTVTVDVTEVTITRDAEPLPDVPCIGVATVRGVPDTLLIYRPDGHRHGGEEPFFTLEHVGGELSHTTRDVTGFRRLTRDDITGAGQ